MTTFKKKPRMAREWVGHILLSLLLRKYYVFDTVHLEVRDFDANGKILDIGGGGEGVIGRLKGSQVVAIDLRQDELNGTAPGPEKIVMDARSLEFPNASFNTATAFFSLMYMKTREDLQRVFFEVWRVLKPNGHLFIWDIDLSTRPVTRKAAFLVRLRYRVRSFEKGTAYGMVWPVEARGVSYYIQMAEEAGFQHLVTERIDHCFFLGCFKPTL